MLIDIWRDLVQAGRSLAKARVFTFICVTTLGLGMTPVIAFQYGSRSIRTPPPGVDAEPLVEVVTTQVGRQRATDRWSYPDFIDLRAAATGVSMSGWVRGAHEVTLPASGEKRTLPTRFVSSNYFSTVGVGLARGAGFQNITDPVVILGYAFWQRHLAADPDIVGRTLIVNGVPHAVAGIAPAGFTGHLALQDAEFFVPLEQHQDLAADKGRFDRSKALFHIVGRLSPGVSVASASAAIATITSQLAKEHPATNEFKAGIVAPYHPVGNIEGEDARIFLVMGTALMTVPLLVVCLNVAGMVQVRSAMRERELSIRLAIGATRRRLIQYLLAEAVVLAALGGTLASIVIFSIPRIVSWWVGEPLPAQLLEALTVDVSMLAVSIGVCLATSLVFGWLPALRFSRPVIMTVLKDEAGSGGLRTGRAHRVTTALQVAIAVPLLVVSFVSLERFHATARADFGFAIDLLYAAPLDLDAGAEESLGARIRRVSDSLATASGVASVTVADGFPMDGRYRMERVSTQPEATVAPTVASAHVTRVGNRYLDTMGIPLLRGHGITSDDGAGAPRVTVISKALSYKLFKDTDAIGQRLTFGPPDDKDRPPQTLTIVGVAADFPTSQLGTDREQLLLPLAQHSDLHRDSVFISDDRQGLPMLMLVARSAAGEPPTKLTAAFEHVIREIDRDFDRGDIVTGAGLRERTQAGFLDSVGFAGVAGGLTLLLAALGIHGVVGLMVATRTREIAVRMTLGASRMAVIGMILFDVVKLVAPGVGLGLLIAVGLTRFDSGFTIVNIGPLACFAGAAIAILTAVIASLAPARRAASVEPMVAMRST